MRDHPFGFLYRSKHGAVGVMRVQWQEKDFIDTRLPGQLQQFAFNRGFAVAHCHRHWQRDFFLQLFQQLHRKRYQR